MADPSPAASLDTGPGRRLIETVQQVLRDAATPGAAVTLVANGQVVLEAGVGSRDLAPSTPLDADAQFYVYSVTKSLLATATVQLVEQGRIVLDAPVQSYLPALPLPMPVTVRQLLRHTGGLPDYSELRAYFDAVKAHPAEPWTPAEFLERTLPRGLKFAPGQGWGYSNVGYLIVRLLLEQVTNSPLREVLRKGIFAPLGLQRTFVAESLTDTHALTPGHSGLFTQDGALADVAPVYHPGWVAHGVVISTAPELARIVEALFAGRLVRPDLVATMLDPVLVPGKHPLFRQPAYGLGLMIDPRSPYGLVAGHGGGGPGYSAAVLHLPCVGGRRLVSVVLANRDRDDLGLRIALALAHALAADPTW